MSTVSFRSKRKSAKRSAKRSPSQKVEATINDLKKMKEKYSVSTNGSKQTIAEGLWRVSGSTIDDKDLIKLMDLLPTNKKKEVKKLLDDRKNKPITNYRGLWEPKPINLNTMNRQDLIHRIQKFRDTWEKITGRNQKILIRDLI